VTTRHLFLLGLMLACYFLGVGRGVRVEKERQTGEAQLWMIQYESLKMTCEEEERLHDQMSEAVLREMGVKTKYVSGGRAG